MSIDIFIATLSGELEPIYELVFRLGFVGSEVKGDAVALSHRPNVAPQAYALTLYTPLPSQSVLQYQGLHGNISPHYLPILRKLNGLHAFQFSLFGMPRSMASDPPLLNRSTLQPFDVGTANQFWKKEYAVPDDWFHFGGGPYSSSENIGYFFEPSGTIRASRKNGEDVGSWNSFRQFLYDELRRAEDAYPAYETFMDELRSKYGTERPWWRRLFKR